MLNAYSFDEILIRPEIVTPYKSREELRRLYTTNGHLTYPVIAANMAGLGNLEIAKILNPLGIYVALNKDVSIDDVGYFINHLYRDEPIRIIPTFSAYDAKNIPHMVDYLHSVFGIKHLPYIQLDAANGHYVEALANLESLSNHEVIKKYVGKIIYGNLGNVHGLKHYDNVFYSLGIGSGSLCKTRYMTGIGVPQATLCMEATDARLNFISDGGVRSPGDVVKALVLGARMVMVGSLFLKTREVLGQTKSVYGSSSFAAKEKPEYAYSEGAVVEYNLNKDLPSIQTVARMVTSGIHSAGSYLGTGFPISFNDSLFLRDAHVLVVNSEQSDPAREFWKDFNVDIG